MKERIGVFLQTADSPETRDLIELKELFKLTGGKKNKCESAPCIAKMLNHVRRYYTIHFEQSEPLPAIPRKHILKPGLHSFAPGGPAVHTNENTTDAEIDYYLSKYPFIKNILIN